MVTSWNAVRADPANLPARGHVESYFLKLNDGRGERALWLKTTLLAPRKGASVAEAWAIAFHRGGTHRAVKLTVPARTSRFSSQGLSIDVGGVTLDDGRTRGDITSGGSRVTWDLRFDGDSQPITPLPVRSMYDGPFPSSKLVSPMPDARFHGHYQVDGERIDVDGWRGMQGHNWGRGHAHLYAWGHVAGFDGEPDLVLEAVTARVQAGPFLVPPLTLICVRHRGVRYEWTRPRDLLRAHGSIDVDRLVWKFSAESDLGELEGEMHGAVTDFVGLTYDNPSGPATACLNSKIARAVVRFAPRGRAPMSVESREAAFEIGTKGPHPVRMVL